MLQFENLKSFCIVLFTSILISYPILCFGQSGEDKWKIEDGNVVVQKIVEFENISKANIYIALKEHLVNIYGSMKDAMQVDDKENGMVIYKGYYEKKEYNSMFGQTIEKMIWHILKVDIKENRIRITVTMNKISVSKSNTTYKSVGNSEEYLIKYAPDDNKNIKRKDEEMFEYAVNRAVSTISSIEEFIRKASLKQNDLNNDW